MRLLRALTLLVPLLAPAPALAQQPTADERSEASASAPTDAAESRTEDPTSAAESDSVKDTSTEGIGQKIDRAAKWVSDQLEAVLFFDLIGRRSFSKNVPGALTTVEQVRQLVDEVQAAGLDPLDVDYTLSLPHGSLTKKQAEVLQKELNKELTAGRTRKFTVTVRGRDDDTGDVTSFTAVRPGIPIVVLWLVLGAVFFTVRMGFINFRAFKHAIKVTAGKYDDPHHKGEVSHFQALTAALSATVGLGNIAGVAIAVMTGGPGATFWMIIAGLLGMSSKFTECTLGQQFRTVRPDGRIMGGAMFYLSRGLKELRLGGLGMALAVLFAVMCIFASFGGGNAFQVNQSGNALRAQIQWEDNEALARLDRQIDEAEQAGDTAAVERLTAERDELRQDMNSFEVAFKWVYGSILAVLVGVVIIGGIRRIARTAEKIVPLMCGVYVLACLWILLTNLAAVPEAMATIFSEAFTPRAGYGALLGVLVQGFRRAAFSNEAGIGSAAIAHSAARTEYPVREGIVALLEPFVDTVIVCTMTALVIVITGAFDNPDYKRFVEDNNGAGLTSAAMGEVITWFPYVLSAAVVLFAYSTMISWSYYGERCWAWMFGDRSSIIYRVVFLAFVVLGAVTSATNVLNLSDLMILGMAFPNILGVVLLSGKVKRDLDHYWARYKAGELEINKGADRE